jgi:ATP-dependent Clp protease ATP-binding subunit ClpC
LNRIDETIVFHQLTQTEIVQIVDLMVTRLEERMKDKDMGIVLTEQAKAFIAERGYDPVLGARPLRRTVQRDIEDVLSEKILFGELKPGQLVVVGLEGEGDQRVLTFTGEEKTELPDTPAQVTAEAASAES